MRTIFIFIITLLAAAAFSQDEKSCCDLEATKKFSELGNDAGFREIHPNPEPSKYIDFKGVMIEFDTPDGKKANGYLVSSATPTDKWILVFHEWYGLNDYIKQESDIIKEKLGAVNMLAVDLYDGQIATNSDEASKLMQSVDQNRAKNIIEGAFNYTGSSDVGTIGWCFGGGWSLNAALIGGEKVDACVMYYGMPSNDVEKLKTLNCPVLGIFAEQDGHITVEIVEQFKDNMKAAGEELTVHMYDAAHGFANPSNPKHDPVARNDAMEKAIAFYNENLMK